MRKVLAFEVLSNKNLEASSTFRRGGVRKTIKHVYETMGTEVDIGGIAFMTSLNVITNMVWGKSLVEDVKSTNLGLEFREVITKIVELLGAVNVSDFFPVLSRLDLQGVGQEMKRQSKILDAKFLSVDDGTTKFDYNGYNPNFIPFGSGRRRCPGVPLGEKMLVFFLASMLHSFDWTLPNGEHELSDKFV
ncbi:geraniol 8-hydroxylase-like protein [Tanacetum coccineum]